ncbi:sulfate transporter family-domain-containing protein [Thamnocephalis sphaerospora]|uniref:Sulfate transporter family-domain-containing protein n=1 Tax=Thamnocephalis sphaerospora TaxID=78915 RepID=A0A4P9XVQ5_9FUNG|nr:sulfate transporter family-domain-containing protein [Thamnocephalis sphaerospora]|eukprot:RKP09701.1 sulfate transporter family-domain-containing protein [Thamnocephalis sphaerospora]
MKNHVPIIRWLPKYNRRWLAADLLAGITVGMLAVPQALAYARLATMPIETGLYGALFGTLLYTFLGTSKDINVGPVAILALYCGEAIGRVTEAEKAATSPMQPQLAVSVAATLALLSGCMVLLLGLLHLGIIFTLISAPVLIGVISGAGVTIFASQLPALLGVPGINNRGAPYRVAYDTAAGLPRLSWPDLTMGLTTLAMLLLLQELRQRYGARWSVANVLGVARLPIAIFLATIISFIVSRFEAYAQRHPFSVVRNVPSGLPTPVVPRLDWGFVSQLLPMVPVTALLAVVEHIAIAKDLGRKNGYIPNDNQELMAVGATNIVLAFFQGFPASGSFSRSAVTSQAGSRSPLSGGICFLVILGATLVLPPAFYYIPTASLAAAIVVSVLNLVSSPRTFLRIWHVERTDFVAAMLALLLTVFYNMEAGIGCAVGFSLFVMLFRFARPKCAVLERLACSPKDYADWETTEYDTMPSPAGIVVIRPESALLYPNAQYVRKQLVNAVLARTHSANEDNGVTTPQLGRQGSPPSRHSVVETTEGTALPLLRAVILDFSAVSHIDMSGLQMLESVRHELSEHAGLRDGSQIDLHFAAVKRPVLERLKRAHIIENASRGSHPSETTSAAPADATVSSDEDASACVTESTTHVHVSVAAAVARLTARAD